MSFASSNLSGSMPNEPPSVISIPALPAEEQMVRSRREAPSLLKKRLPIECHCT